MRQIQRVIHGLCAATFFSLLPQTATQAQTPEELYKHFEETMLSRDESQRHNFSWITPQIRAELTQYARTQPEDPQWPHIIKSSEALLYLGDLATIKAHVDNYRKADGNENAWGPPDILPYLVEDLSHASSENHDPYALGHYSLMDTSLFGSYQIVSGWAPFPAATRSWARDNYRKIMLYYQLGPKSTANRLMREWWEHNQNAVLSRQYEKATWLPPVIEEVSDFPVIVVPASTKPKPSR